METQHTNNNEWLDPEVGAKEISFREHAGKMRNFYQHHVKKTKEVILKNNPDKVNNECVKLFARSHASTLRTKVSKQDINNLVSPLSDKGIGKNAEKSPRVIGATDWWSSLISVGNISPKKFSKN